MPVYIFDTFALVAYFLGEKSGEKVKDLMVKLKKQKKKAFLCKMNLGELYYAMHRKKGEVLAEEMIDDIGYLPISLVSVDWNLILSAAKIKAVYPISFADAFAVALAKKKKGIVVTNDPEFKEVEKEVKVLWI